MITTYGVFSKAILAITFAAACTSSYAASTPDSAVAVHPYVMSAVPPRAVLTLTNPNNFFRDVKVASHVYTVLPHQELVISAPVGTQVFTASTMFRNHAKNALLAKVAPGKNTIAVD